MDGRATERSACANDTRRIFWRSRIGHRLLIAILVFSSAVTLTITSFDLYRDYRLGLSAIDDGLAHIQAGYAAPMGESLWILDTEQIQIQLRSIATLPDIRYIDVHENGSAASAPPLFAVGQPVEGKAVRRDIPLWCNCGGHPRVIGALHVEATLDNLYQNLFSRALIILASQTLKTFLTSVFILFIIHHLVTRHLLDITSRLRNLTQLSALPLRLRRDTPSNDEFDELVHAFNALGERIAGANAELERFAEISAHHLQEPAGRIARFTERLQRQLVGRVDDPEAQASLQYLGQQARRQQTLLRDIQRYLAANQPRGDEIPIDPRALIQELWNRQPRHLTANAELILGELPPTRMDLPRLKDIFQVALDNALTHGRGTNPLRLTISGACAHSRVVYSISDNGPGIEPIYRERVFRVFERLSANGENTGIGLAILRRVVSSTGGSANLEPSPQGGCCLVFDLPHAQTTDP